jgi:hypothetical protein
VPVPVPANYLRGLDVQRYDFEVGKWSYLRGEQKMRGWWYYYLYAIAVKMPVGTLFLIAFAAVLSGARMISALRKPTEDAIGSASRINMQDPRSSFLDSIVLLAPAIAVIAVVSSQTGFNRYLRYVLPAFPFLFIWSSQVARLANATRRTAKRNSTDQAFNYASRLNRPVNHRRSILVFLALVASNVSSLAVFPHSLSYFNEIAGGPQNGAAHLLDANVDWGQDLLELKRWCDAHPEARPFHLVYFGFVDPRTAGLDFAAVHGRHPPLRKRGGAFPGADGQFSARSPGWYALSANKLEGYKYFGDQADQYAGFRQLQPVARAGYSIIIFQVTEEETD